MIPKLWDATSHGVAETSRGVVESLWKIHSPIGIGLYSSFNGEPWPMTQQGQGRCQSKKFGNHYPRSVASTFSLGGEDHLSACRGGASVVMLLPGRKAKFSGFLKAEIWPSSLPVDLKQNEPLTRVLGSTPTPFLVANLHWKLLQDLGLRINILLISFHWLIITWQEAGIKANDYN